MCSIQKHSKSKITIFCTTNVSIVAYTNENFQVTQARKCNEMNAMFFYCSDMKKCALCIKSFVRVSWGREGAKRVVGEEEEE